MGETTIDRRSIVKARIAVAGFIVVISIALGVVVGVVAAGDEVTNNPLPANVVTVSGGATVDSAPDKATVTLGVNTQADTAEGALTENTRLADAVLGSLEDNGVTKEDIQTTDARLDKRTQDRGTPKEHSFYVAENEVTVVIRDLDSVGTVISDAVAAGANDVRGVEFGLESSTASKSRALAEAVENARVKAETLAKAAGAELGPVVRIDEQRYEITNLSYAGDMAWGAEAALKAPAPMPISTGQVQTSVEINVVFELET